MKNTHHSIFKLMIVGMASLIGLISCNQLDPLTGLTQSVSLNYATVNAQFCTSPPAPVNQKIKYLFIIDHSGSNLPIASGPVAAIAGDVSASDPDGHRRYGSILDFVSSLPINANVPTGFNLIDFSDSASIPYNLQGNTTVTTLTLNNFDTNQQDFITQLRTDWDQIYCSSNAITPATDTSGCSTTNVVTDTDKGFTDYSKALQIAQTAINNDATYERTLQTGTPLPSTYQVFFISDGQPIISCVPCLSANNPTGCQASCSPDGTYTEQFATDLAPLISEITGLPGQGANGPYISNVFLNTVFYYQGNTSVTPSVQSTITNARALLSNMAQQGNGKYFESSDQATPIDFQSLSPPVVNIKYLLADVFVENESVHWWDNGQLLVDTDLDGIPDQFESSLGSNKLVLDSDKNGVRDLIEYRQKGRPCNDSTCNPNSADTYSICNGLNPTSGSDGTVQFPYSSTDGLNDCEKLILGAKPSNFNNAGDFIPDLLAIKNNLPFLPGQSQAFADPFGDGITNYNKLKLGLPISMSKKNVTTVKTRAIQLEHVEGTDLGQDCYSMTTSNVVLGGGANSIKVYVIQNRAFMTNTPLLQTATHTITNASTVSFSASDFK